MRSSERTKNLELLLRRCRRGDRDAYREVYRVMGKQLYGTALRILERPEEAEEVVQEGFVKLLGNVRTVRGSLGAWLHRVTVNLCLDRLRSKAGQGDELPADLPATGAEQGPGTRIDLGRAVEGLPERARLVFLLHDVEGYKHEEVGKALGISPGTSKAQLFRARELLRRRLNSPADYS